MNELAFLVIVALILGASYHVNRELIRTRKAVEKLNPTAEEIDKLSSEEAALLRTLVPRKPLS